MFAGFSEAVGAVAFCARTNEIAQNTTNIPLSPFSDRFGNERCILYRRLPRDTEDLGASAVEFRSTSVVFITYSVLPCEGAERSLSVTRAWKAILANSCCDICTVVRGGVTNCARCMSSKPIKDKSRGIWMPR